MIDAPRGDILITLMKNGEFVVYNACAMTAFFVPREIVISFLDKVHLSKEVKRVNILDNKEA